MTLTEGEIIDRYRLEQRIGAGAFGEVWKASQLADGEDVGVTCAIKVMKFSPDRTESSARGFASGWLEEVRNLVRVAGETIPRILEANVWRDHAYIAMELLEGSTLGTRLQSGVIPWRRALFIADQIASALEAAHQVGVVHRDLKPQNVVLAGGDRVCVIDWGIASLETVRSTPSGIMARAVPADLDATDATPVAPVTTPRQRPTPVGTPGYMAPEVYEGAATAPAQDVFALGVVLYEMLSGRLPQAVERPELSRVDSVKAYRSALDKATMDYAFTPLRDLRPDLPAGVLALVDALIARAPESRPDLPREAIGRASRFPHGIPDPPYAGLVKLGPERAGLYYGQQDTTHHVLERLRTQRAALLWGPSGSGKSSLALAGVAATMDRTLFAGADGWTIHVIRPREAQGFRVVDAASPRSTVGSVVVIDQLEEVVDLSPSDQATFCEAILALLDRSSPVSVRDTVIGTGDEVRVVATIRDDLEWRVDREVPALRPLLERRIIVKGVDANFARSIIEEPARALAYSVEGVEAVSREVEERLSADASKLPVVQYALSEWWERRDSTRKLLPLAAWKELGGVDGALSTVAERFFTRLDPPQQGRVRTLFLLMFVGERKQPLPEAALLDGDRSLVDELARLRLIGRREKQGSAPFYEVEHESLARNWSRLAGWLAEAREDRALADEFERDAEAYARNRDAHRLWKAGRLLAAREMITRGRVPISSNAQTFLADAKRARRRGLVIRIAALGTALAAVLGVIYVLVLSNAASAERDQAMKALADAVEEREGLKVERQQLAVERDAAQKQRDTAQVERKDLASELEKTKVAQDEALKASRDHAKRLEAEVKRQTADVNRQLARMKAICGFR